MASKPYAVRLDQEELEAMRQRADRAGIPLAEAFRRGAAMYLAATPETRARFDAESEVEESRRGLEKSVQRAQRVLRGLGD